MLYSDALRTHEALDQALDVALIKDDAYDERCEQRAVQCRNKHAKLGDSSQVFHISSSVIPVEK